MKFTKKLTAMLATAALAVTAFASTVFAAPDQGEVDWDKGVVRAVGTGISTRANVGQARAMARRAAIVDAQRNLAEQVAGVQVTAETTMRDLEIENDLVRTRVEAIIKGMRMVGEPVWYEDGSCEVTLEMPLFGAGESLASAAFIPFQNEMKEPFPQPSGKTEPSMPTSYSAPTVTNTNPDMAVAGMSYGQKHTGLIINCTGLGLNPVMSPVIKNDSGQPIYGYRNLDYDKVIAYGMADYTRDINEQTRAGNNPLVVMAVSVENHNAYPVVTISDADSILIANQHDGFLDNCAVVFVR